LQVSKSTKDSEPETVEARGEEQKKMVEELRVKWKQLWNERLNDKVRAEDISASTYDSLKVERGTIIHATRDYKPLNFKEILEDHKIDNPQNYIAPDVNVGGWTKFVKTEITGKKPDLKRRQREYVAEKKVCQQPKKGGRGWLHKA
jgi:hypothetical protein